MINREPIYAALFGLLENAADFAVIDRRLRHWSDVAPAEQPALFMAQKSELATVGTLGAPTVWTLSVDLYVYAHSSDPYLAPATVLNPLIDAVEAALAPSATTGIQDLGLPATVQHAYISGKIETDEGVLGDQAVAVVPVAILCV
jgi:hypothetical protein